MVKLPGGLRDCALAVGRAILIAVLLVPAGVGLLGLGGFARGGLDAVAHFAPLALPSTILSLAVFCAIPWLRRPPYAFAAATAGLAAYLVLLAPEAWSLARQAAHTRPGPHDTVVVSLNTRDATQDDKAAVQAILAQHPDVITLQEGLRLLRAGMPGLKAEYPYHATCAQWWGCEIVILSRRPITASGWGRAHADAPQAPWLVWARTTGADGRELTVVSTHLWQPLPASARRAQQKALVDQVAHLASPDLILTGDFNGSPTSWSQRALDHDLPGLTRRTLAQPTWPDQIGETGLASPLPLLPIDHVYAASNWKTVQTGLLAHTQSDHRGIWVRLSREPEGSGR